MRNSRASCRASTTSGGNSRPPSMRAAAAASAGASARALTTQSAVTRWSIIRPWAALVFFRNPTIPVSRTGRLCSFSEIAPIFAGDFMRRPIDPLLGLSLAGVLCLALAPLLALAADGVLEGRAAFGDWRADRPGVRRHILPRDLPAPQPAEAVANFVRVVQRTDQKPLVPPGFAVNLFASGLAGPRTIRAAPNGDIFVAESRAGRISVLRPDGGATAKKSVFASGLNYPFGIAFYPPGADPQWVYVADTGAVLRFPYRSGDLSPRGEPETVVSQLPVGGHATRDIVFSPDGATMYVSVGSRSNDAEGMSRLSGANLQSFIADHPLGAAWDNETDRADVLAFDRQGKDKKIFATGHSQLRRHGDRAGRHTMVHDQRARRPRQRPAARLRHARARRLLLWLAVVLHRRQRRSASPRRASRPQRPA